MKRSSARHWRILRLLFAIATLAGFTVLFALPGVWSLNTLNLTATEFMPGLLNTITWGAAGAFGTIFLLAMLTAICGRVYCSWLCPLGVLQDVLDWCNRWTFHRGRRNYPVQANHRTLRIVILTVLAVLYLTGLALPLGLAEPYTLFGRIAGGIFRHLTGWINTAALHLPLEVPPVNAGMAAYMALAGGILLGLCGLVVWKGRIFCNTVCPAGTLLAGIAANSGRLLAINAPNCVQCGQCAKVCKAGCIDFAAHQIDFERCVMCLNCTAVCPQSAIELVSRRTLRAGLTNSTEAPAQPDRRRALLAFGAAGAGALAASQLVVRNVPIPEGAIAPPGAGSVQDFLARCTGCGLCMVNCRGKVLQPALGEYGLRGWLLPTLKFDGLHPGKCEYECNNCTRSCPTGALRHLTLRQKQRCRLGLAEYDKNICIAYVEGEPCGACAEHCPTGALRMVDGPHPGATIPQLIPELCIGCGNCQYACPVTPIAAIRIRGVKRQDLATYPGEYRAQDARPEAPTSIPF